MASSLMQAVRGSKEDQRDIERILEHERKLQAKIDSAKEKAALLISRARAEVAARFAPPPVVEEAVVDEAAAVGEDGEAVKAVEAAETGEATEAAAQVTAPTEVDTFDENVNIADLSEEEARAYALREAERIRQRSSDGKVGALREQHAQECMMLRKELERNLSSAVDAVVAVVTGEKNISSEWLTLNRSLINVNVGMVSGARASASPAGPESPKSEGGDV